MNESGSYLQDLAKIEAVEMAEITRVEEQCRARIDAARAKGEKELAELPILIQQERQETVSRATHWATMMANEVKFKAEVDAARLSKVISSVQDDIVRAMMDIALSPPHGQGEPS